MSPGARGPKQPLSGGVGIGKTVRRGVGRRITLNEEKRQIDIQISYAKEGAQILS